MLEELKLSNFRIFDNEVVIRFRPITVLIGKNNAGKSSIIKFLLMLNQSIDSSDAFLEASGPAVDLGDLYDLKHKKFSKRKKPSKKDLNFSLKVKSPPSYGDGLGLYISKLEDDEAIKPTHESVHFETGAKIAYRKTLGGRGTSVMKAWVDDQKILSLDMKIDENSRFLDFSRGSKDTRDESVYKLLAEQACRNFLSDQIKSIQHISPLTAELSTAFQKKAKATHSNDFGQRTLHLLHELVSQQAKRSRYDFIQEYLENVINVSNISFEKARNLLFCYATNSNTGCTTNIADFGFGVSQCLPFFVQGAMMKRYATLIVEQPEAQVHPTAQLELGSFFAKLWTQQKVYSIIETHSDNILLRLRTLIALGEEHGGLVPDDVSVAFFDFRDGQAVVRNLSIDENGGMEDGLPLEFFGANIGEGLRLGAAKYQRGADDEE